MALYVLLGNGFAKEKYGVATCRKPRVHICAPKSTYMPGDRCGTCGELVRDHLSVCYTDQVTLLLKGVGAPDPCPLCGVAQQYHRLETPTFYTGNKNIIC